MNYEKQLEGRRWNGLGNRIEKGNKEMEYGRDSRERD